MQLEAFEENSPGLFILGGERLTTDLLGLVVVLLWRFRVGLHVSAVKTRKKEHEKEVLVPSLNVRLSYAACKTFPGRKQEFPLIKRTRSVRP